MELIFIGIAWLIAIGLGYWKMETKASKLKKIDPTIYEKVKDNPELIKDEITNKESERDTKKQELEHLSGDDEDDKKKKIELETEIAKIESEISFYQSVEKGNLSYPVFSFGNIAWTLGTFLISGFVLHFLVKKISGIFSDKRNNN